MPVRIRKSFNLFPGVKVNMSKGGMSITAGTKGFLSTLVSGEYGRQ